MTKHSNKKGRGRPKFKIDLNLVRELSSIMCTQEEISRILGCSVDTLQRSDDFCGIYKEEMAKGKCSLRRAQFTSAIEDENVTMQIWLGKILLGQKEERIIDNKSSDGSMTPMTLDDFYKSQSTDT